MGPRKASKDMLDNVVNTITCVIMNHQNQLEQMANGAMFVTSASCFCYPLDYLVSVGYYPAHLILDNWGWAWWVTHLLPKGSLLSLLPHT
jgi:hypothetical protein